MSKGFTLIELLIVVSIMAVIGVFTVANYRSFGEDKDLDNAALDIVSLVRAAQTNASAGLKCNSTATATEWRVVFNDNKTLGLKCYDGNIEYPSAKILNLGDSVEIADIASLRQIGTSPDCYIFPSNLKFYPLSGTFSADCDPGWNMQITVNNTKTASIKEIIIEKGGRVYVQ